MKMTVVEVSKVLASVARNCECNNRVVSGDGVSYIEDKKTVSYNQVNTAVLSALDFVAIGTGGLIAQGIPASQAAVLALNPTFNPLLGFGALQSCLKQNVRREKLLAPHFKQFQSPSLKDCQIAA